MSNRQPSLNRPRDDYRRFVDYVNLDDGHDTFDVSESVGVKPSGDEDVWYGRETSGRGLEVLYRTSEGRWVLVFVIPPGQEDGEGTHPLDRELTPVQAARWLRLNEIAPPAGLKPASLNDSRERKAGQARLDRDWRPRDTPHIDESGRGETHPTASVLDPVDQPSAESDGPAVVLNGPGESPIVLGRSKPPLSAAQYATIKAIQDAGRSLKKDELSAKARRSEAHKHLKKLASTDPDWAKVIVFPKAYGLGYDIRRD